MDGKKLTLLFQSDFSLDFSGFGKNTKNILSYLYRTGKYNIVQYCCGRTYSHPDFQRTPWKTIGCVPNNPKEIEMINRDPNQARLAGYGAYLLDKVIREEKPDVYIAVQDFWGVDFAINRPWFDKINSVIWTTLDSLPLHKPAVELAPKIKNYWVWSSFAEKELHKLGHKQVRTVHGAIDDSYFSRLPDKERVTLRRKFNLPQNSFIIGFVFRNQLRKSVYNLLEGYKLWKTRNPEVKNTFLLLHTHFSEGWDIPRAAKECGVPLSEILTTYVCRACKKHEVKPFEGENKNCRFCGAKESQKTTHVQNGVSEEQLNEVYNLMDVYCHPFTSGGQELPIQEAKLTELVTLVTNYSCGEELCEEGSGSLPLDFSEYREIGTQFRKASTLPSSIAKQLHKVYSMDSNKRREMGKQGREYVLKNFSITSVGRQIEEFLDSCTPTSYDFKLESDMKNPNAEVPTIEDDGEWIISLYRSILKFENINSEDEGFKYWSQQLKNGAKREEVEKYFRQVAAADNAKNVPKVDFSEILGKDDKGKRILYVMPESIGDVFLSTSLFENLKKQYPDYNLYVATKPENFEILEGNPHIYRVIQYIPQMDDLLWLEGCGAHDGYFEVAFLPHVGTQRIIDYTHNGKFKMGLEVKE